jgi:Tol biopolymer transport system component
MRDRSRLAFNVLLSTLLITAFSLPARPVQAEQAEQAEQAKPEDGLTLAGTRQIEFETREGTWLSLDVSPDGEQIVFELLGDLYLLPIEGGDATPLTTGMAFDSQPRFAPDGERVVFVSDRDGTDNVWTVAVDGSDPEQLTSETGKFLFVSPEYAPDGSHVIVAKTSWGLRTHELWAYHVDGGKGIQMTVAAASTETPTNQRSNTLGAVYSPDGRYLYFARKYGGFAYNVQFPQWQVARRDLKTGEEDYLTQAQGSAFRPRLSPDGSRLVYGTRYEHQTGLRLRNLDTGEDEWLAYPVERDEQESRHTRDLLPGYAFTPDGSTLLYSVDGGIRALDVESGESREVPFRAKVDQSLGPQLYFPYRLGLSPVKARMLMGPQLSPDGRRLAFSSFFQIHVYDLDSGEIRSLTPDGPAVEGGRAFHPAWSPDGKELAYVSWSSTGGHLWRIRANGSGRPVRVSEEPGYYSEPAWSPAGDRVLALRASSYDRLYRENDWGWTLGSDLIWFDRKGGEPTPIAPSRGFQRPHFGPEADRVYLYNGNTGLSSIRYDGTDRRNHLAVKGPGILLMDEEVAARDIRLSPDGTHALALHANQLYLIRLLNPNLSNLSLSLAGASLPMTRLTDIGADFFGWSEAGQTIFWTVGNQLYERPLVSVSFQEDDAKEAAEDAEEADDSAADEAEIAESHEAVSTYPIALYRPRHEPTGTLVLQGATVLTMAEDAEPINDATVIIVDNRIELVSAGSSIEIPEGAEVVDVSGAYLLPGFIDTHAHHRMLRGILEDANWGFLANLAYGVTTGLDVQPGTTDVIAYEDLIDAGLVTGPRALSTGPGIFSDNNFHSVEHARAVLRRYKDHYGVRNLKAYLSGDRGQRQYLVQAAAELKLMPTTEGALDMRMNLTHAIDGFSGNEHALPLVNLYEDVVQLVAQSGLAYTPTLLVAYGGPFAENYFYTRESPHRDPKLRRFMPANAIAGRTLRTQWFMDEEFTFPQLAAQAAKIIRAGGRVGVGAHGQLQGLGYHWEMWALAAGGLQPMEVLTAATRHGAEIIGVGEDLGTVTAGKLADLVILAEDPREDIRNTNSVRFVVKNGELYDADSMDKLWPESVPLPEMWWWKTSPESAAAPKRD